MDSLDLMFSVNKVLFLEGKVVNGYVYGREEDVYLQEEYKYRTFIRFAATAIRQLQLLTVRSALSGPVRRTSFNSCGLRDIFCGTVLLSVVGCEAGKEPIYIRFLFRRPFARIPS